MVGIRLHERRMGLQEVLRACHSPLFLEVQPSGKLTAARSTHTRISLFSRSLGAGLFTAWADPDYGWESNVSGEAAF